MRKAFLVNAFVLILAATTCCWCQEITGTIRGTVTDPSGNTVANAVVIVTNTDTNLDIRQVTTNQAGEYVAPLLPVGNYSVSAQASGFQRQTQSGIMLHVGDKLTADFRLVVGSTNQTVEVNGSQLEVQLQNASAEGLISGEQVRGLPINNRNYEQLVALQPGVAGNVPDQLYVGVYNYQNQTNTVAFSVGGGRSTENNWTVDGVDNLDRGSNLTLLNYPSVDAIQEFKLLRGTYEAEYGRSASGQVNVITRSGTKQFHGGVYEFFRNDALNANNYFNNRTGISRPPLRYNDFGGTFGGPLILPKIYTPSKSRTFFFFSEEMRRIKVPVQLTSDVPSAAMKQGQFPIPVCIIFDAQQNCTVASTTAPITPQAQAYIKDVWSKIPDPQGLTSSDGSFDPFYLNYPQSAIYNYQEEFYRLDHQLTDKITLTGRFLNDKIPTIEPGGLFTNSGLPNTSTTKTNSPGKSWMGRMTYAITPNVYEELGYGYSYGAIVSNPTGYDNSALSPDVAGSITLPNAVSLQRIPTLSLPDAVIGNVTGFGQYRDFNRNHNVFDNLNWILGNHSLKFGFSYNHYEKDENSGGNNTGTFTFTAEGEQLTDDPNADTYQTWANFLTGQVEEFTQASTDLTADILENSFEGYAQDDWRMRNNLTLSYGIRYSNFLPPTDGHNLLTNFNPASFNPQTAIQVDATGNRIPGSGDPLAGMINGNHGSPFGGGVTPRANLGFAPRLGFAWDPFSNGKTSVRGGYGVFMEPTIAGLFESAVYQNLPYNNSVDVLNTSFSNPGGGTANVNLTPPEVVGFGTDWHNSYVQQWSVDVQRELADNLVLDVGYYGEHGVHLVGQIDINELTPGTAAANGFTLPVTRGARTLALNPFRPYPGWGVISIYDPIFGSNYNGLQTQLQKRFRDGSTVMVNYTFSKGMTDNQTASGTQTQDTYAIHYDYGLTQLSRKNVFNASYVYSLPFFRDQSGFAGHVLGGWQAGGILVADSGLPLTLFQSTANGDAAGLGLLATGGSTPRPNLLFSPQKGALHSLGRWYNPAAFAVNRTPGEPGNEPRGAIIGPGYWRYDMSLQKQFKIYENLNTVFRVEAFNLFNHTNYNAVSTTSLTSTFNPNDSTTWGSLGQVTSTRDPRLLQLALRLNF